MVHQTGAWGWHVITNGREALTIAALISATDPVATLATYSSKKVDHQLDILVFGESTINDAVAIVLFCLLNEEEHHLNVRAGVSATGKLVFGSIMVGLAVAFLLVGAFRLCKLRDARTFEVLYVFASAYLINSVAEMVHMSGIIACLFGGMFMGIYLRPLMSFRGNGLASYYLKTGATMADLTVFIMVGFTVSLIESTNGTRFGLILVGICLIARFFATMFCGGICNIASYLDEGDEVLNVKILLMMWHAGLRGGIALTLCLQINDWCKSKAVLVTATFIVIFVLMLLLGGTTDRMLQMLQIPTGVETKIQPYFQLHEGILEKREEQHEE